MKRDSASRALRSVTKDDRKDFKLAKDLRVALWRARIRMLLSLLLLALAPLADAAQIIIENGGSIVINSTAAQGSTGAAAMPGLVVFTTGSGSGRILCYCHDTPAGFGGRKWTNLATGAHGSATWCPSNH